jgi:DNA-directed RNA polymerase subunit RPC12/RpoP
MAITLERQHGLVQRTDEQFGLECPYCGVYAHMSPQSVPDVEQLLHDQPKHIGMVYQCDACSAPVFLRFAVRQYSDDTIELYQNFVELERPKERFPYSYLPKQTESLFREALSCYSNNNFNAFASMCRRAAYSSFAAMGEAGKLRAFDEVMMAQNIAEINDNSFEPIKKVLFDSGDVENIPLLNRAQAGILLEVMKDMFYQCFVRRGKLTRAIKVRQFFVQDGNGGLRPTA